MSFIVDLPPDVETRIQEEATRQGVPDVALRLITGALPELSAPLPTGNAIRPKPSSPNDLPYEERKARFDALVNRADQTILPDWTPEMSRRRYLYEEDEEPGIHVETPANF